MKANMLVSILKIKNLPGSVFASVMAEYEGHAIEVDEKEDGVIYEFDYYSLNGDGLNGFIKNYKIYSDNTYSTTIIGEYHDDSPEENASCYI